MYESKVCGETSQMMGTSGDLDGWFFMNIVNVMGGGCVGEGICAFVN